MAVHPELEAEQAYVERAYRALEAMRESARRLRDSLITEGRGGTHQSRYERDVFVREGLRRLQQLEIGDEPLVFGRVDREDDVRLHIGRVGVADDDRTQLVVDWRAPAAEPFYRATGLHPLGLRRRRHFLTEGRRIVAIEDEDFAIDGERGTGGSATLLAALERSRTGHMRDIVATIQREQDEIIRAPLEGILVVQGGPGTGKTAVGLHRAAYLLFTHRHTLERDGVLVVGPNQLFLRYIGRVLPALGESGAALSTIDGLVDVRVRGTDPPEAARVKGDARMAVVIAKAVGDRQRPLAKDAVLTVDGIDLRLTVRDSEGIIASVRRARGRHNTRRSRVARLVQRKLFGRYVRAAAAAKRRVPFTSEEFVKDLRALPGFALLLDRMWPKLSPADLLHDLYGSGALLALAADGRLTAREIEALHRPWVHAPGEVAWTSADAALMDEAAVHLGPLRAGDQAEVRDYGHIVVDEAQDLSPMQLRMLARRSRHGSMTIVGDVAQATGQWAPSRWDDVLAFLPQQREPRTVELTVNYRTPAEIMDLAGRVLATADPQLKPPEAVRSTGEQPSFVRADTQAVASTAASAAVEMRASLGDGRVAVICAASAADALVGALVAGGIPVEEADANLDAAVTVIPAPTVKGLEFDGVVVVEPAAIVGEAAHGEHALYVALTRATKRLVVVHAGELPAGLAEPG